VVAVPAVAVAAKPQPKYRVGDMVEGCFSEDSVWYQARIDIVLDGPTYKVTYLEYGNEEVLPESSIRVATQKPTPQAAPAPQIAPAPQAVAPQLPGYQVGEKCIAQFSEDLEWYNAVIDSIAPDGKSVSVTFTDYGNKEIVLKENLKKVAAATSTAPPVTAAPAPAPAPILATPVVFQQPRTLASASPLWKVGDACEACFSEDQVWYTAKIDKISPDYQAYTVIYLEYGNSEVLPPTALRSLHQAQAQVSKPKSYSDSYSYSFRF